MLDSLWPGRCAGCGRESARPLCRRCAPAGVERCAPLPGLGLTLALAPYDSPAGAMVRRAKVEGCRRSAVHLGWELAGGLSSVPGSFDAVVPVPTPWARRARRGFCLPSILAAACARELGAPVIHALRRGLVGRRAASQRVQRRVRGYGVRVSVEGRVLLIDDVCTTGATLIRCAELLTLAGAGRVTALTLCSVDRPC